MLSKEDYNREIGKSIFIYPLDHVRILGNSVDLTASKFAWTSDKKYIYDESTGKINVPAHKTACIITQEAIYVKSNIGGTYHSRVSLAKKGFTHIGTMLDPEFYGQSLIVLHNTTDETLTIDVKGHERIVSIVFYYLHTPVLLESHKPNPGHFDKLADYENIELYNTWRENNRWATEKRELVDTFKMSEGYKKFQERKETDENAWSGKPALCWKIIYDFLKNNSVRYILFLLLTLAIYFICSSVFHMDDNTKGVFIGTLIAVLLSSVLLDTKK